MYQPVRWRKADSGSGITGQTFIYLYIADRYKSFRRDRRGWRYNGISLSIFDTRKKPNWTIYVNWKSCRFHFLTHRVIMAGIDESQYKFTGIQKYFNSYTKQGRLNVSINYSVPFYCIIHVFVLNSASGCIEITRDDQGIPLGHESTSIWTWA